MLRLRPLRPADEAPFRAAHAELEATDDFPFGIGFSPELPWEVYLKSRRDHQAGAFLPERFVPNTFLVAEVDGEIVGRISIRHQLNDFLLHEGGHIGYCVRPACRRRGYATEILRQGLIVARSLGIDRVLVTCDDDNQGSSAVIEACGGRLDSVVDVSHPPGKLRRYWID
jgi:predicted acetyltransferase